MRPGLPLPLPPGLTLLAMVAGRPDPPPATGAEELMRRVVVPGGVLAGRRRENMLDRQWGKAAGGTDATSYKEKGREGKKEGNKSRHARPPHWFRG